MSRLTIFIVIGLLLALAVTAGTARAHGRPVMAFDEFKPRIWNQFHWTNRAQRNRCRETYEIGEFTRHPLSDVSAWWRDDRVVWAKRKHRRAQERSSICSPRDIGKALAARLYGWVGYEWEALDAIVMRESAWNPCRHYPSTTNCSYSGPSACGIPQANPCEKLLTWCGTATIGACSATTQIRWLLRYIDERYGSPSAALANGSTY